MMRSDSFDSIHSAPASARETKASKRSRPLVPLRGKGKGATQAASSGIGGQIEQLVQVVANMAEEQKRLREDTKEEIRKVNERQNELMQNARNAVPTIH